MQFCISGGEVRLYKCLSMKLSLLQIQTVAFFPFLHVCSCVIATTANYTSQKIGGAKKVNKETLYAYGLYG